MKTTISLTSICVAALLLVLCGGCSSATRGGAPEPTADIEDDLKAIEARFSSVKVLSKIYEDNNVTKEERNELIAGRLVAMNLRYLRFVREMTAEKQLLDSASDILILSLNLLGAALSDTVTKTALAASSAAVAGSRTSIDKHFYYEKTIPALVAAMNAERKKAIIPILEGRDQPIERYSLEDAITDLDRYYHAGSLIGAVNSITASASQEERAADTTILQIRERITTIIPTDVRDMRTEVSDAIERLTSDNQISKVIKVLDKTAPETVREFKTIAEARAALTRVYREAGREKSQLEQLRNIMKSEGLIPG